MQLQRFCRPSESFTVESDRQTDRQAGGRALGDQWSLRCLSATKRATVDSDWICADRFVWRHVLSVPPHSHLSVCVCHSLSASVTVCPYLSISVYRVCVCVSWHVSLHWSPVFLSMLLRLRFRISPSVSPPLCLSVSLYVRPSDDDETNSVDKCNYWPMLTV